MIKLVSNGFISMTVLCLLIWSEICFAQADPCEVFYTEKIEQSELDGAFAYSAIYNHASTPTGCILGKQDTTEISVALKSLYANNDTSDQDVGEKQDQIFDLVLQDLESLIVDICSESNMAGCIINNEITAILRLRAYLDGPYKLKVPLLSSDNWTVKNDGRHLVTGDNVQDYVVKQCQASVDTDDCEFAVMLAAKIIRSSSSMQQLVANYKRQIIGQNKKFLTTREKEWNQYFNVVSVQYPWELGFNSWLYTKDKSDEELAKFPRAPESKYIAMHPSIGYEYIKTPNQNSSLEASVLLEIAGYEMWKWNDGEASNRWGGSVVVSFADIQGMDAAGYGLLLHTPIQNTSIGVIWRGGDAGTEPGVFINVDLAKLLMNYKDKDLGDFLKKIE